MISGCVGGVLRDILCNDVPRLVVTGALSVVGLRVGVNAEMVTLAAFLLGLAFRLLAIRLRWEMPKFVYSRDWN